MKYICLDCGCTFNDSGSYLESREGGTEEFNCCPSCKSKDYIKLKEYITDIITTALDEAKCDEGDAYNTAYELFENEEI